MYQNHLASLSAMASRVLCQSPYPSKVSEQPDWDPVLSCPILGIFPGGLVFVLDTQIGFRTWKRFVQTSNAKARTGGHTGPRHLSSLHVCNGEQRSRTARSILSRWVSHRTLCQGRRRELRVSGPTIGGRGSGASEQAGVPADTSSPAHKFWELVPAWELSRMEEKVEGQD